MKKLAYYLTGLSVVLNIYYFATWISSCSLNLPQNQTVQRFMAYYPSFVSLNIINISAIALTALSVALLLKYRDGINKSWLMPVIAFQTACLLLYIWQYL